MPLRFYDNNDWRSPTSIKIYDNGDWQEATVGYVYDLGVWKVVFPDPITPSVQSVFAGAYGDRFEVDWEIRATNCDYLEAYLYAGSTQTNLLQTQIINTNESIIQDLRVTFSGLDNNTTYNMKIIGYSITETPSTPIFSGPVTTINVIIPTVNITSMIPNANLSSVQINWNSTDQYDYEISIWSVSDSVRRFGPVFAPSIPSSDQTYTASFQHQPNTQYRVDLRVYSTSIDTATDSDFYTTPNNPIPYYTNFVVGTITCNSIQVNWNAFNYTSGTIEVWNVGPSPERVPAKTTLVQSHSFTSLSSYTFSGLSSSTEYGFTLTLTGPGGSITSDTVGSFGSIIPALTAYTLAPSISAPTITQVNSSYIGTSVAVGWTSSTANCTTVSSYTLQFKETSSSTWLDGGTTQFITRSVSGLSPNTTYDYRVKANAANGIESAWSSTFTATTNNGIASIEVTANPSTITTFGSSTITGQLKNAAGANLTTSGVAISWTQTALSGSTLSESSSNTNSSGQASATLSTGSTNGSVTVTATASSISGSPSGSVTVTVNLSAGLKPTLSPSGTTKGASFTNSNYNALYSYTNVSGYPSVGSLESGDSYNSSQFDILVTRTRSARNTISKSGQTATTTNPTFDANPLVSMSIVSSRTGYTSVASDISTITAGVTISSRTYQWQQFTNSTWNTNFGAAFSGMQTATLSWSNTTFSSRQIRCIVTTNFSSGQVDESTSTNTVTIP